MTTLAARALAEDEFLAEVRGFRRSAFHFEGRREYALGYERADFEQFLAGSGVSPPDLDWWRPWLDRVKRWTTEGKSVSRVRVVDEPPTDYQRWMLWSTPWHAESGEDIRYITRRHAERIGLPLDRDWWLLDDRRLILMRFTDAGETDGKELVTDPLAAGEYGMWRDLAVRHSAPADQIEAA